MGKRINIDERIKQIRNERYDLLTMISDSIRNNRNLFIRDIKNISDALEYDEKTIKRYEAIVKAQELIASLTEEICFAQTEEEIVALRKKINQCINRIKAELKRRNVDEQSILKYQESINYLRKDIAKYIRVLKREGTVTNLEGIYKTYESLSDEEKENFMKILRREHRYNQRNLYPKDICEKKEKTKKEEIVLDESSINKQSNSVSSETFDSFTEVNGIKSFRLDEEDLASEDFESIFSSRKVEEEKKVPVQRIVHSFEEIDESDKDFLRMKIKSYDSRYNLRNPHRFGKSVFGNIGSVIKNIPIYKANQKTIQQMKIESQTYYGATDFISYIAYLTRINSIQHGLKSAFNRSYLYSREGQLLNDHEKCADWILDYCNQNSLQVNFLNRTLLH